MTLEHLKYFVAVFEHRSIYRAASCFYISPQGISQGIRRLEGSLGIPLFTRTKDGLEPTGFGKAFYTYAVRVVQAQAALDRFLADYKRNLSAHLRLGFLKHDYRELTDSLLSYLAVFQQSCPEVSFEVQYYETMQALVADLRAGKLHLSWALHEQEDDTLAYTNIYSYAVCCVMGRLNPLAAREALRWTDLQGVPLIVDMRGSQFSDVVRRRCEASGFCPSIKFYSTNGLFLRRSWKNDGAVSLVSEPYARLMLADDTDGQFALRPLRPELKVYVSLITGRGHEDPPLLRRLIDEAKAHLNETLWLR